MSVAPAIVCLVGLRCAGKSTVGRALAGRLGWPFEDLDEALAAGWAREQGVDPPPAGALLERVGLEAFRAREREALLALTDAGPPLVLATGGGCVESAEGRARLARARTFWLDAPLEVLAARLRADPTPRPSLTGADPARELARLAARRAPLYAAVAEATLDGTRAPDELAADLAERLASDRSRGR